MNGHHFMGGFDFPHSPGSSPFEMGNQELFHKTTPEIIVQCKKVKKISQLQNLGSMLPLGYESSELDIKEALSETTLNSLEKIQIVMLILIIPPSFSPNELYNSFLYISEYILELPFRIQTGLALKWVRTSIFAKLQEALFDSHIIHRYYENNPDLYTAPYLYLCSASDHPESIEVGFSGDVRINALTLYYSAINKMLLGDFNNAEMDFLRALALSKKSKDLKDSILTKLSLCSFLNRTPKEVYQRRVPLGRTLPKIAEEIWKFDRCLDVSFLPPFYKRFAVDIAHEHARCVILNLASTVTVMNLGELKEYVGEVNVEKILEDLKTEGTLITTINDGYIYFNDPVKTSLFDTKIQQVEQLLQSLRQNNPVHV